MKQKNHTNFTTSLVFALPTLLCVIKEVKTEEYLDINADCIKEIKEQYQFFELHEFPMLLLLPNANHFS